MFENRAQDPERYKVHGSARDPKITFKTELEGRGETRESGDRREEVDRDKRFGVRAVVRWTRSRTW